LEDRGAQELLSFPGSHRAVRELITAQGDTLASLVREYCARADREGVTLFTEVHDDAMAQRWATLGFSTVAATVEMRWGIVQLLVRPSSGGPP
jgi:hypothetical protein